MDAELLAESSREKTVKIIMIIKVLLLLPRFRESECYLHSIKTFKSRFILPPFVFPYYLQVFLGMCLSYFPPIQKCSIRKPVHSFEDWNSRGYD